MNYLLFLLCIIIIIFVIIKIYKHSDESFAANVLDQGYITMPSSDNIVQYNGCYTNQKQPLRQASINKKVCQPYSDNKAVDGRMNHVNVSFMSTSTNGINDIKTNNIPFYIPYVYMHDPQYKSYRSDFGEQPADVDQIGSIPVNNYDKEPVPVNE